MICVSFLSSVNKLSDYEKVIYIFIQNIKDSLKCLLILVLVTDFLKTLAYFTVIAITKCLLLEACFRFVQKIPPSYYLFIFLAITKSGIG